ncbi:hypothetical protein SNE510_56720 [Streptomyces sp. NE5-10]|uniref:hypothetical protein n=1 Tax=Streptomyces sp. NE5-10 TaxID=2759674 RepID=UPI001A5587FB|nr:hypothetical protein [Streptomyces sp. NE5-10]GHJ96153.1 hypothetical protein SNE510_56720 [Streptomyces sp. NE5-10]
MSKQRVEMRHRQPTDTDEPEIRPPDPGNAPAEPGSGTKRKIDLSVPQVAGSALAAVIAAKLASTMGVYGTILGAGVISVVATCGGPLFQQLFKHTGEQMRDVTVAAKPRARQLPARPPAGDRPTLMLGTVPEAAGPFPYDEEFGDATTHGTRLRGWRRPVLAAALVFGVTMGGITTYELVSGEDFSGTKGTTTFGSVVRGGGDTGRQDAPGPQEEDRESRSPAPTDGTGPDETGGSGRDTGTPSPGATPGSGTTAPSGGATTAPTPDPTGSADGGTDPTGEPTAPPTEPTAPGTPSAPAETPGTGPALGDAPAATPSDGTAP